MGCSSSQPEAGPAPATAESARNGEERVIASMSFNELMKNPETRSTLREFAESEYSAENISFYDDAKQFRKRFTTFGDDSLNEQQHAEMRAEAERIVNTYLCSNAPQALNLPSKALQQHKDGLSPDAAMSPTMFDPFVRIIYKAIETDTYQRFTESGTARASVFITDDDPNRTSDESEADMEVGTAATGSVNTIKA